MLQIRRHILPIHESQSQESAPSCARLGKFLHIVTAVSRLVLTVTKLLVAKLHESEEKQNLHVTGKWAYNGQDCGSWWVAETDEWVFLISDAFESVWVHYMFIWI